MRRQYSLLAGSLLASLLLALAGCGQSPTSPFAGTWKVIALPAGQEVTMWLVRIEARDDGLHAAVLSTGLARFEGATVSEVRADGDVLHLTFTLDDRPRAFVFCRPDGESAPQQLLGSAALRGERDFARLERTDLKALDPKQAVVVRDTTGEFERALKAEAGPAREAALRKAADGQAGESAAYVARLMLAEALAARGAEAEARDQADRAVAFAAAYGPEMKRQALLHAARRALAGKLPALAVDYARQAEQALDAEAPPEERLPVLKVLVLALRGAGRGREADEAGGHVAEAEEALDRASEERAVPFTTTPFAGRKGKGERVVLVELFTGANCPPCAAADVTFDALLRTYAPRDVVAVQYHLHVPAPDPLANRGGERRADYYGVPGTPAWLVNGRPGPAVGGPRDLAHDGYKAFLETLAEELERETLARLRLTVGRRGERIDVTAEADGLKPSAGVRLRLLLVEDVVRYPGINGQRLHRYVVRALPGGAEGLPVRGASARHEVAVNLADVRKSLADELAGHDAFKDGEWPLELKRLKVVGMLQDDDSQDVLQAAQADVPEK
jgi:hypothetical protein